MTKPGAPQWGGQAHVMSLIWAAAEARVALCCINWGIKAVGVHPTASFGAALDASGPSLVSGAHSAKKKLILSCPLQPPTKRPLAGARESNADVPELGLSTLDRPLDLRVNTNDPLCQGH